MASFYEIAGFPRIIGAIDRWKPDPNKGSKQGGTPGFMCATKASMP